ncbi:M48 family metalloprotease [Oligoflexus tunisiensis]|uniref:M48 family metalloprotease n=1 Tax=Oligoflexus tunisiensis TaxID=708132 RepID=UPI00114D3A06|nr:M48 family metalloprotease [Oligoflexus tunisiensis]
MLRHILGSVLTFLGIMAMFVFWYFIIPLGPKFVEWQRDPQNVLLGFAIWALLGGLSCLLLSRHIANWAMRVDLFPLDQADPDGERAEMVLQKAVDRLALKAKPQLGIYEQPELNAYITGVTLKNSTLVLSRGALQTLSAEELEILMGRELLHFKSGDVKGLAFMEGMIFAFTLYVARMLAFLLGTSLRQTEEEATSSDTVEVVVTSTLTVLLTLPGALVFWWFSRSSAMRADAAVARVFGKSAYAALLARLSGSQPLRREIFSDAFKLHSRPFPVALSWLALQPDVSMRSKHLSA